MWHWQVRVEARGLGATLGREVRLSTGVRAGMSGRPIEESLASREIGLAPGRCVGQDGVWHMNGPARSAEGEPHREVLRESEERLNFVLDATLDGVWDWDVSSGHVYFSPQWARLLGHVPGEIPSRVEFFYTVLHPEDVAMVTRSIEDHFAGRTLVKQVEVRLKMKSGDYRWFFDRGKVVQRSPGGEPLRMVGTITDITERKKAEAALRVSDVALKAISQGVLITDDQGRVLAINRAFTSITGYREEDLLGREYRFLHDGLLDRRVAEAMEAAQREGREFVGEVHDRKKDGTPFWNDLTVTPVRDDAGQVTHSVAIVRDLTQRRHLAEQLRQAQKMDAIGQLAGGVAHDFNNILGAILGNTDLALAEIADGQIATECLNEIRKSTLRAKSLVQQILAFSRQQPSERRVLALGSVVEESIQFLRSTIPATARILTHLGTNVPVVMADPAQMHQVLVNLCTNAWHALEDQPGEIEVRLESVTLDEAGVRGMPGVRAGRFACLTVSDTGKGIEREVLGRIFEPFFTTKEPGQGTGLGLSVVHGIVQEHDGWINVTNEPGRGAAFHVYFPAAETVEESSPAPSFPAPSGGGERILFLDDETSLVSIVVRILVRLGYRVTGCASAAEALGVFERNPTGFDLVITDLNMPGVSGLQVAAQIRRTRPDLPVVLCSGRVTDELRQQASAMGVDEIMHKPCGREELSGVIRRLLDARASGRAGAARKT